MGLFAQQARVAPVQAASEQDSGPGGIGGFFVNAFRDLTGIAAGLGTLGGAVLHDIGHAATGTLLFEDFVLDDLAKALPGALAQDLGERYGSPGKFIRGIYEHPLFFLQDALTVATAGGYGAAKAAQVTARSAAEVGTAAKALGAATVGEEAALLTKGALAAGDVSEAAKFVQRIQGTSTKLRNPLTGRVEELAPAFNPVRRALGQNTYIRAISDQGGRSGQLAERYMQTAATLGEEGLAYANTGRRITEAVNAAVANGERVIRPSLANYNLRRFSDFAWGSQRAAARTAVEESDKVIEDAIRPLVEAGVEPEAIYDALTGVDVTLLRDEYIPRAGRGLRDAEVFDPPSTGARIPETFDNGVAWPERIATQRVPRWGRGPGATDTLEVSVAQLDQLRWPSLNEIEPGVFGKADEARIQELMQGIREGRREPLHIQVMDYDNPAERILGKDGRHRLEAIKRLGLESFPVQVRVGHNAEQWVPNWLMVREAPGGAPAEAAIAQAIRDRSELTPALREALKDEGSVLAPEAKSLESIRLNATLSGGDIPDDVSRFRVVIDQYDPATIQRVLRKVEETTGGKVRRLENTVYTPDAGGERYVRAVVEMADGHPVEFQIATARASRTLDATSELVRQAKLAEVHALTSPKSTMRSIERARKLNMASQALWGGVTAEVRAFLGGPADDAMRMALHDTRLAVQERFTNTALRNGLLDPLSMFDNPFMPLRVQHGATWDSKLKSLAGGGSPVDLWDMTAKAGLPQPVYFPMVSRHHVPGQGAIMAKLGGRGPLAVIDDQFLKKNTGELVAKGLQLKDPMRAYHIRAQAAARAEESMGLVNRIVAETGREIHNFDQAGIDEVVLSRTHIRNLFNTRRAVEDAGLEALQLGEDSGKHIARALENALVENQAALAQLDNPDLVAVPRVVYDRLQAQGKVYLGQNIDLAFKTPTQLWKSMVLAGSPRWVVNNIIGNITFLKMQGGRLSDVVRQLDPAFRKAIKEAMGEPALQRVEGGLVKSVTGDIGRFTDENLAGALAQRFRDSRVTTASLKYPRKWKDFAQRVNSEVEDAFRRASYLTAAEREATRLGISKTTSSFWTSKQTLEDVFRVGIDEKSFGRAVGEVNKYLNDYHAMTPFGRNILRPYLAPFWSFYRHATKLLLTSPFEHPLKTRLAAMVNESLEDQLDTLGPMPPWMKGSVIPLGGPNAGDMRFFSTAGANPFNIVMDSPGQMLNPAWKVLFEQATGVSMFTGRAFSAENVVETPFGGKFRMSVGPNGQVQAVPIERNAPGLLEHFLQQVPQYEMVKDLVAGGSTYDTTTLLQALQGRGVILDPETGQPSRYKSWTETLAKVFGYSIYPMDLLKYQENRAAATEAAITSYRRRLAARGLATPGA